MGTRHRAFCRQLFSTYLVGQLLLALRKPMRVYFRLDQRLSAELSQLILSMLRDLWDVGKELPQSRREPFHI